MKSPNTFSPEPATGVLDLQEHVAIVAHDGNSAICRALLHSENTQADLAEGALAQECSLFCFPSKKHNQAELPTHPEPLGQQKQGFFT